ncbi:TIGR03086 family metal-binding protein, partial [Saccharothrix coeruleofusca]|uniref:TIGR03086 family metal-binding protein n=1 Tax=Saccharothrix coeruleofusca TaxID=33919 RepID=UPI001671289E
MDLLALDRAATALNVELTSRLTAEQLDASTPCAGWTVRDLLHHQVDTTLKFGAALGVELEEPDTEPVTAYRITADRFAEELDPAALDREADFPGFGRRSGKQVLAGHFVDHLVHAWDLAKATGRDAALPTDLAQAAFRMARRYPSTPDVR